MYEHKDQSYYFSSIRDDLIQLIPSSASGYNVLEIGCGTGATLKKLKDIGIATSTTGIELNPLKQNHYDSIDYLFLDNIETMEFSPSLKDAFDIILVGDVLEHLIDPWTALKKINNLLKMDGKIIMSIPNIRHYSALKSIFLNGDFKYTQDGILDQTHLRFFAKKNIIELIAGANLEIERLTSQFDQEDFKSKKYWLNRLTFGIFHDFFIFQYLIVATKKD